MFIFIASYLKTQLALLGIVLMSVTTAVRQIDMQHELVQPQLEVRPAQPQKAEPVEPAEDEDEDE